jgi:hypothetical protein
MMYAKLICNENWMPQDGQKSITLYDVDRNYEKTILLFEENAETIGHEERYEVKTAQVEQKRTAATKFGRLVQGVYDIHKMDQAVEISHSILPLIQQQYGFVGVFLFVNTKNGENFSISIWEKEEDSQFNIESGWWMEQVEKFNNIYLAPPTATKHGIQLGGFK